jgi:hypothetical protein
LYDKDDTLIGTIKNSDIVEYKDSEPTYYKPVVLVETTADEIKPFDLEELK